uniref:Uncharacterized protein n=1 Tax=Triticum urartu TaxID=4572 RepID=A0A8R7TJ81_TRIUA
MRPTCLSYMIHPSPNQDPPQLLTCRAGHKKFGLPVGQAGAFYYPSKLKFRRFSRSN